MLPDPANSDRFKSAKPSCNRVTRDQQVLTNLPPVQTLHVDCTGSVASHAHNCQVSTNDLFVQQQSSLPKSTSDESLAVDMQDNLIVKVVNQLITKSYYLT